jgi:hypothetical protein
MPFNKRKLSLKSLNNTKLKIVACGDQTHDQAHC